MRKKCPSVSTLIFPSPFCLTHTREARAHHLARRGVSLGEGRGVVHQYQLSSFIDVFLSVFRSSPLMPVRGKNRLSLAIGSLDEEKGYMTKWLLRGQRGGENLDVIEMETSIVNQKMLVLILESEWLRRREEGPRGRE